jgi:hypothetical protein
MPVKKGKDKNGSFYRWGHQKKYYYVTNNKASRDKAYLKAQRQGRAIKAQK